MNVKEWERETEGGKERKIRRGRYGERERTNDRGRKSGPEIKCE